MAGEQRIGVTPYPLAGPRYTAAGDERRVGVELELAGLRPSEIAGIAQAVFDGELIQRSAFEYDVSAPQLGRIEIEIDARWLQRAGEGLENLAAGGDVQAGIGVGLQDALEALARRLIPCEVVMPPLPISALQRIDPLVERLREAGAVGTRESVAYAFALQLNPEIPALTAQTVLRYLQAFLCLYDWLVHEEKIPLQRRLLPFVDAFPKDYARLVLDDAYAPRMSQLIDDYLAHNPTRNRALDLLPLLAHIDEPRVRAAVGKQKVKPRPAFHYRLPSSDIDQPGWSPRAAWTRWLQVEQLAADGERLAQCRRAWREHHAAPSIHLTPWHEKLTPWLAAVH